MNMKMPLLALVISSAPAVALAAAPVATVKLEGSGDAKVGMAAPSFGGWDLAGKKVLTFDSLRRTPAVAPLLITFGASWCTACASGLPRLKALSVKHQQLRLIYIGVEQDQEKAQQFAARMGIDGPALLDKFEVIARRYGVAGDEKTSLPRTFLVDDKGKVRAIYREEGSDLEKVIEADLAAATAR
jgi:cytochrome c biogenesis protein CcmG/thiol:disulfide interchange protein DsbE